MKTVSHDTIQKRLKEMPPHNLLVVYDGVSYMADRFKLTGHPELLFKAMSRVACPIE